MTTPSAIERLRQMQSKSKAEQNVLSATDKAAFEQPLDTAKKEPVQKPQAVKNEAMQAAVPKAQTDKINKPQAAATKPVTGVAAKKPVVTATAKTEYKSALNDLDSKVEVKAATLDTKTKTDYKSALDKLRSKVAVKPKPAPDSGIGLPSAKTAAAKAEQPSKDIETELKPSAAGGSKPLDILKEKLAKQRTASKAPLQAETANTVRTALSQNANTAAATDKTDPPRQAKPIVLIAAKPPAPKPIVGKAIVGTKPNEAVKASAPSEPVLASAVSDPFEDAALSNPNTSFLAFFRAAQKAYNEYYDTLKKLSAMVDEL